MFVIYFHCFQRKFPSDLKKKQKKQKKSRVRESLIWNGEINRTEYKVLTETSLLTQVYYLLVWPNQTLYTDGEIVKSMGQTTYRRCSSPFLPLNLRLSPWCLYRLSNVGLRYWTSLRILSKHKGIPFETTYVSSFSYLQST